MARPKVMEDRMKKKIKKSLSPWERALAEEMRGVRAHFKPGYKLGGWPLSVMHIASSAVNKTLGVDPWAAVVVAAKKLGLAYVYDVEGVDILLCKRGQEKRALANRKKIRAKLKAKK